MKVIVTFLVLAVGGCAVEPPLSVPPDYLAHVTVRIIYVSSSSARGELEIRNAGNRTIFFADPLFTFSAYRAPLVCNLAAQFGDSVLIYESRALRPYDSVIVPLLENDYSVQRV